MQREAAAGLFGHDGAGLLPPVDAADFARDGHGQGEDEFRDGARVRARRVEDCDVAGGAGRGVDLVGADAVFADGLEVRARRDVGGAQPRAADEEVLCVVPGGAEFGVGVEDDVEVLAGEGDGVGVEFVEDVDGGFVGGGWGGREVCDACWCHGCGNGGSGGLGSLRNWRAPSPQLFFEWYATRVEGHSHIGLPDPVTRHVSDASDGARDRQPHAFPHGVRRCRVVFLIGLPGGGMK